MIVDHTMINFTKTNRWKNLKAKMTSPTEKELLSHIELLEWQIQYVNALLDRHEREDADDGK